MSPYLQAFDAYHAAGEPFIPWTDALDFHFQHGAIISNADSFLMARQVPFGLLEQHPTLTHWPHLDPDSPAWHVWSAAGQLDSLLDLADRHKLPGHALITFQRGARSNRVHRMTLGAIRRHLFSRA